MNLTTEQIKWLDERGGRNEHDVRVDKDGLYVWMYNPRILGQEEKMYLPGYPQLRA